MKAVMLEVDERMLEQRRAWGADGRDEMWEGVLHMVLPAGERHQHFGSELLVVIRRLARARGLRMAYEIGLYRADDDYRVPDLAVYTAESASERGIEQRCELVIEIRSPGDETDIKLPWYIDLGVTEVLIIDRDSLAVELFTGLSGVPVAVRPAHSDVLDCTFERIDDDTVRVTHAGGTDDVSVS